MVKIQLLSRRHKLNELPMRRILYGTIFMVIFTCGNRTYAQEKLDVNKEIRYCAIQATKTLKAIPTDKAADIPRNIDHGSDHWRFINYNDWCSGFWPGILWYLYEGTKETAWKKEAEKFTNQLVPLATDKNYDHDLGFMVYNSFGNGYRLTGNPAYKKVILSASDSLARLFNPKIGTILSWPKMVKKMGWPHNTIIDNMINLEVLFWASRNGGSHHLYDIAVQHAETTMKNHFRPDYSSYHVVVYDTLSGKKIKGVTHQGYSDSSMWARGQSWAIYGFTMCYRETKKPEFLAFAQKVADRYLRDLPADHIPYWDFNAPGIPNAPKDASAACVTASALLDLSTFVKDRRKGAIYARQAKAMLLSLSSAKYQSRNTNDAFLLHSTGHKPAGSEIDASIIYADYYYLEALIKLKRQASKGLKI